jgi:hypothetical protein
MCARSKIKRMQIGVKRMDGFIAILMRKTMPVCNGPVMRKP